jgi:hypothetical protein
MEAMEITPHLWVSKDGVGKSDTILFGANLAPWVLMKREFQIMIDLINGIRTPYGYGSSFKYKFTDYKISSMKMHNQHNLLHHLLLMAIRGLLTPHISKYSIAWGLFSNGNVTWKLRNQKCKAW